MKILAKIERVTVPNNSLDCLAENTSDAIGRLSAV